MKVPPEKIWLIPFIMLVIFIGCTPRERYNRWVRNELAGGKHEDSLFLGLRLGMTDKEFYGHCWELNKQGLIRQGEGNTTVLYKIDSFHYNAEMNFYPSFYEGRIWQMPVKYEYAAWAPWNTKLFADSLQLELVRNFRRWYGMDFLKVRHPIRGMAYINISGNRRTTIYKKDDHYVVVLFTDLLTENKINALKKNATPDENATGEENPMNDILGETN